MQAGGRVARLWKKRMPSTNRIRVSSTRHRAGDLGLATLSGLQIFLLAIPTIQVSTPHVAPIPPRPLLLRLPPSLPP